MKRLRPMFSYYGSKWRLSPKYPFADNEYLIEPFAGSACYSLLYWWKKVELYDLDENIYMIWDYLIHATEKEILQLPLLEPGETIPESLPIEAQTFMGFFVGKARAWPGKTMSTYNKHDKSYGCWSEAIRLRVASQLKYIRHWQIFNSSYENIENKTALWFIDPPYIGAGKYYRKSSSNIDYDHLGLWCKERLGNVIVCENLGADWLPFEVFEATRGIKKKSQEVIWRKGEE